MSDFTTRPELRGTFGMVASTHWLASAAGMSMLERGGNAFDAAVAAGFVLQVVEPHLNGPGGEVPILLHDSARRLTRVLCGQGVAPQAATIEAFRDLGLDRIPGSGLLATVVPGCFDAWAMLLRDHGTMSLAEVLEPAIGYAEGGYPVVAGITAAVSSVADLFRDHWPGSAAVYLQAGRVPQPGHLARNPAMAATYKRLLADSLVGRKGREDVIDAARRQWSQGFVAEEIDRFCRTQQVMDSSGRPHGGLLTGDDMVGWQATYEQPVTLDYFGLQVCKTGAWGQGPVFLQQLALLKGFDLGALDPMGDAFIHIVTEAAKLAFADREAYYGDPDFVDVPLDVLLSSDYAEHRRALIDADASLDLRPGHVEGKEAFIAEDTLSADDALHLGGGEPTMATAAPVAVPTAGPPAAPGDTCHLDVVDRWGNMVSATPSGGWLQSSPVIPELGFCLNSRAQMFWLDERAPSALGPGRRPRTTLTPTLVMRDGAAHLALGTPGGDAQDQWALICFLRHVHHGLNLQQAIDAPTFNTRHFPASFFPRSRIPGHLAVETRLSEATLAALDKRGHRLERAGDWALGRLAAVGIERHGRDRVLKAGANPRLMQGYAVGR
ncbi:MAG: gamma-glutamyltransferase family protein [Rhodospirillaceae bacterium]|nr:gamma-glutamyltransferase family protein [Rhodospirillaceae bacterium]MCA8931643.1 gamma-glutamyltransferase family protein [Rhodospirillaceae bacterium]